MVVQVGEVWFGRTEDGVDDLCSEVNEGKCLEMYSVTRWFLLVPAESGKGGEDLASLSQMCVCMHESKIR